LPALLLAACGATNEDKPDAKPSDTATEAVAPKVADIAIKDGKVAQQSKRVEVKIDQPITLRVTTDTVDEAGSALPAPSSHITWRRPSCISSFVPELSTR